MPATGDIERQAAAARGQAGLKALLVTSDPEVLEALRRAFRWKGFNVVGEAWPGIDAVRRAAALRPDVVILHIEEPIIPALRTAQALADACDAGLAVISSAEDLDTVRRVMNAGAHDFATLPLTDEELRDSARRAASTAGRRMEPGSTEKKNSSAGRVVTVAGARGGVGKSTIAANLAIEIARTTRAAVAIADLDFLFGSAAMMLDTLPEIGLQEWKRDRTRHASAAVSPYLTETRSGVRLLAAPTEPDATIEVTPDDVADLISDLSSTYDYVVLDTPPGYSEVTAAALDLATLPLLVTTPEVSSLRAARFVVNQLRERGNTADQLAVILNYARAYVGMKELAETPGAAVRWEIRHDTQVLRAASAGVPVSLEKPGAALPRVLREVAAAVAAGGENNTQRRRVLGVI